MKGSIEDVLYISVTAFAVILIILAFAMGSFKVNEKWQNQSDIPANSKSAVNDVIYSGYDTLFNGFVFLFFGIYAVALILASRVDSHPALALFAFLLLIIIIIISSAIGYAYTQVSNSSNFISVAARYPIVDFLFRNYAATISVMGILMIVVLFAKFPHNTQGGY